MTTLFQPAPFCAWLVIASSLCMAVSARAGMRIGNLTCEYARDPLGIDTLEPRLGWTLLDESRGQVQTAYQVQVAASAEDLARGRALLWDTGKAASGQGSGVAYAGRALRAGERCHWRVRAWDRRGKPTAWSTTGMWQVALLQPSDWKARWIGHPDPTLPEWGDMTFAADVTIGADAVGLIFRARDSENYCMWQISAAAGPELLLRPHIMKGGKWSLLSPAPLGRIVPSAEMHKRHGVRIETRGKTIRTFIDGQLADERADDTFLRGTVGFRAAGTESAFVENVAVTGADGTLLLAEAFTSENTAFPGAKVEKNRLVLGGATLLHRPPLPKDCPRFRRRFVLTKPISRATASVCGLGFYELYINGAKAGDRVLAPANSQYRERLLFDTLDITAALRKGDNVAGLWLAAGYSDDYSKWGWKWEEAKRAILQIDVLYNDGTAESIVTDGTWETGPSPLTFASLYHGEVYDARLDTPGWCGPACAGNGWRPVRVLDAPGGPLAPNIMPPLRVMQTIRPVSVAEPKPGIFVFDMGQNFAGWARIRASGKAGTRIVLAYSELTSRTGRIFPWTNRGAKATDVFVLKGEGAEQYEPRFTYHGFRYVEITGYPGTPTLDDVAGCVVHAAAQPAGSFGTSDPTINRIHSNCVWSMRSNQMSIPTDCSMRDERTPCQMDSLAYEDAALCNFDLNRYYAKWLGDIRGGRGNPDWNGDMVFLPWRLYWQHGDVRILEENYSNMRDYVEALHAKKPDHIWTEGFGDWCAPNDDTWEGYFNDVPDVNTCLYAALTRIVAETAAVLGKTADAARFAQLSGEIAGAYNEKRYHPESASYGDGSQTTAILPLALDLVPPAQRQAVFDRLLTTIHDKNKDHVDTGIFGTRYLVDVLCDFGQADLALTMLKQPTYPGFGHQIAQGATTLWEQWTFEGGMNSHNHAMFAGVDSSFYTRLAGITALKPGYAQIGIRPFMPKDLGFAEASQDTVRGRVSVRWERKNGNIELKVRVPVSASALVSVPAAGKEFVTEGGKPAEKSEGVAFTGMHGGCAVFAVGSGNYDFAARAPQP